jgi:hypothetical protein
LGRERFGCRNSRIPCLVRRVLVLLNERGGAVGNTTFLGNLICSVFDTYQSLYGDREFAALATEVTLNDLLLRFDVHDSSFEDQTRSDFFDCLSESGAGFDFGGRLFEDEPTDEGYLAEIGSFDVDGYHFATSL